MHFIYLVGVVYTKSKRHAEAKDLMQDFVLLKDIEIDLCSRNASENSSDITNTVFLEIL